MIIPLRSKLGVAALFRVTNDEWLEVNSVVNLRKPIQVAKSFCNKRSIENLITDIHSDTDVWFSLLKSLVVFAVLRHIIDFKGIDYLQVRFFLLLNLEAWNLVCVCKIEKYKHFVNVKFSIFGLEIGLRPKNRHKLGLLAHRSTQ